MTTHTPGPWAFSADPNQWADGDPTEYEIDSIDCAVVATVGAKDAERAFANARLIAAAPELLEALDSLASAVSCPSGLPDDECLTYLCTTAHNARALLDRIGGAS